MTWTLTDEGEFILDEAYSVRLHEIKRSLIESWVDMLCSAVAESTLYPKEVLMDEFLRRCEKETGDLPVELVDEFIIQSLEGSLDV